VCDRIAFGGIVSSSFRGWAASTANRYGQRRAVKVYVSPEDPMTAVLEPGVHWMCWIVLTVGTVLLGLGVAGLLSYFEVFGT
jgi:hypothetical protein